MSVTFATLAEYLAALEVDAVNWLLSDDHYHRLPVPGARAGGYTVADLDAATLDLVHAR